jgi:hypothetical protein
LGEFRTIWAAWEEEVGMTKWAASCGLLWRGFRLGVCFLFLFEVSPALAIGPAAQSDPRVEAAPIAADAPEEVALPSTIHPEIATVGLDFVSRLLFGRAQSHAVALNGNYAYVGLGKCLVVLYLGSGTQPIMTGWLQLAGDCSGVDYSSGSYAYVTDSSGTVSKVSIANPTAPSVSATYVASFANDVAVSGTKVFVAAGSTGLLVLDATTMALSTSYNTPGSAPGVDVLGNYAYVADGSSLQVLDITTTPPTFKGSVATTSSVDAKAVTVGANTRVYVADNTSTAELRIIDATTPTVPSQLGVFDATGAGGPVGVDASGTTVYLADGTQGLRVVDATTPAAPVETKSYTTTDNVVSVVVWGTKLVLGARGAGVHVVDPAPATPTLVGAYRNVDYSNWGLATSGSRAYCLVLGNLLILDVSIPARPSFLGSFSVNTVPRAIRASGTMAYVIDGSSSLKIIDASVPSAPSLVRSISVVGGQDLDVDGTYAYVAKNSGSYGLSVYRLSDGVNVGNLTGDLGSAIELRDGIAYLGTGTELVTVSVANPAAPSVLGRATVLGAPERIRLSGNYALACSVEGVEFLDVSTPSLPFWVALTLSTGANDVLAVNGLAYIGGGFNHELSVQDITQPWAATEVASYTGNSQSAVGVGVWDGYALLMMSTDGAVMVHYSGQCYDLFEPNDLKADAASLSTGAYYDSFICNSGDQDYFAVTAPSGGTLTAVMEPPSTLNYDLYLYDSGGTLLQASPAGVGQQETVSKTVTSAGTYFLLVNGANGNQYSPTVSYRLTPSFTACAGPSLPLLIYNARRDVNNYVILDIQDPNQPSTRTGYNIYRATSPSGPWTLIAGNVVDMDAGTANTQYVDQGSTAGPTFYYNVRAVNGTCGAEGP